MLEHAGLRAPAGVIVAHPQRRRGDGEVQPHRPRIARCRTGDDSEATFGIVRMAAATALLRQTTRRPAPVRTGPRSTP